MFEQNGFAAPARSDNSGNLIAWTIEIDAVKHLLSAKSPPQIAHHDCRTIVYPIACHRLITSAPGLSTSIPDSIMIIGRLLRRAYWPKKCYRRIEVMK